MSGVDYDAFLPSVAGFLSADAAVTATAAALAARSTIVQFESGRQSLQAVVAGSGFLPARGALRGEIAAAAGLAQYADTSDFTHALGRARVHLGGRSGGGWLGFSLGRATLGAGARPVAQYAAGAWAPLRTGDLSASASRTSVGDTAYVDVDAAARWNVGRVRWAVALGARLWDRGTARGAYGSASATIPLTTGLSIILSGGSYPTDPIRGTLAGRQLSAGLRLAGTAGARVPAPAARGSRARPRAGAPRLELGDAAAGRQTIRVHAPGARAVEIMGDFTDWQPVTLTRATRDRWEVVCSLPPGARRLTVRVDGGPWRAPAGTTRVVDEFGAEVGILVVP